MRAAPASSSAGRRAAANFADGTQIEADVIVGADGINSTVRESLFGAQPVRFTQQMAWRCIVPIECVPTRIGPAARSRSAATNMSAGSARTAM